MPLIVVEQEMAVPKLPPRKQAGSQRATKSLPVDAGSTLEQFAALAARTVVTEANKGVSVVGNRNRVAGRPAAFYEWSSQLYITTPIALTDLQAVMSSADTARMVYDSLGYHIPGHVSGPLSISSWRRSSAR